MKHKIRPFGFMINSICNLSCHGCNRYIDHNLTDVARWDNSEHWVETWSKRVYNDTNVSIIGGEPTMNPDLKEWIYGVHKYFPDTPRSLTTNGIKIPHLPDLYEWLCDTNTKLYLTEHSSELKYQTMYQNVLKCIFSWDNWEKTDVRLNANGEASCEFYKSDSGITLRIQNMDKTLHWVKSYKGYGTSSRPYNDGDLQGSLDTQNCGKIKAGEFITCNLIYRGNLYKCSSIALLKDFLEKYNLQNHPDWRKYYLHNGLSSDCSDEDLKEFSDNRNEPHWICGKCPSKSKKSGQDFSGSVLKEDHFYKGLL